MLSDWLAKRFEERNWSTADAATHLGLFEILVVSWLKGAMPEPDQLRYLSEHIGDPYSPPGVGRTHQSLREGDFVEVRGTRWGVVKLQSIDRDRAIINLFGGPGSVETREVVADCLRPVIVTPQTRCYLYDPERYAWAVGRVKHYDAETGRYLVDLPDQGFADVPPENLEVRSAEVERSPTEVLIERGHETTFFYLHRSALTHALTKQRALTRGLTGLTSSRIHLYAHQVETVRRVLSDPVPRYILADEVGLGKTIEAGIIARQHLLDDPDACVVIVVPPHLHGQWHHEWDHKFALRAYDPRVHLITPAEVDAVPLPTLLVVDEAHHLGQSFARDEKEARAHYDAVRRLAQAARTILLLTATPSALAPEGLLGLLHLIDPVAYDLDDRTAFNARLRLQEEISRTLSALSPSDPVFLIEEGLSELEVLFPDDTILTDFISEAKRSLIAPENAPDDVAAKLENVRHHIKETYRLFQRLLRHRRRDVEEALVDRSASTLHEEFGLDVRERDTVEALETWRQGAVAAGVAATCYAPLYVFFAELGGADLDLLAEAVAFRQHDVPPRHLTLTLEERALLRLPLFTGEEALLAYLHEAAAAPLYEADFSRADLVAEAVRLSIKQGRRVVVFVTRSEVVPHLADTLGALLGNNENAYVGTLSRGSVALAHNQIDAFENAPAGVLVVDHAGEEGLNLQFADVLIHYDLPLDPNRLEQRTGRLDRLGRTEPFDMRVLLGSEDEDVLEMSPYWAWYRMVRDGFGLFDTSVASLQFFFDDEMPEILTLLFEKGPPALASATEQYRERAAEELRRIRQQDLLTAIDVRDQQAKQLWDDLQTAEAQQDALQEAVHQTLSHVWRLRCYQGHGWMSYTSSPHTMLPLDVQLDRFLPLYDRKVTKHRALSVGSKGRVDLIRPGSAWVQRLASFQEWDDRGQAYALWRRVPDGIALPQGDLWWSFVFDILVEAEVDHVAARRVGNWSPVHQAALQRQGDALLAPRIMRVVVGPDGQVVTESPVREVLLRPFDREADTNLHKERVEVLDTLLAHGWAEACRRARRAALNHTAASKTIQDTVETARRRLAFQRKQAAYQRARREARHLDGGSDLLDHLDLLEASISTPRLRVDAAGFVVLSSLPVSEYIAQHVSLLNENA